MAEFDADYLLRLAREKSAESRNRLGQIISDLFAENHGTLTERERMLYFDILRRVIREFEMSLRKHISQNLADSADVPVDLAAFLANDDIDVAYPILTRSAVLGDEDLIEVIRHRTLQHQLAVALRNGVSEPVCDVLVKTRNENVIRTLLLNETAKISHTTMEYLVEESRRVDTFQEPILHRRDLDPELAKRMFLWVSAALRQHIIGAFNLDQSVVDDLLERTAMEEITDETAGRTPRTKADELAAELTDEGAATPELLIKSLSDGEVSLFVAMFQRLTGLREKLVLRMLFEPGGEGLAIACKAIGIDKDQFSKLFTLSRKARHDSGPAIERELKRVLRLYENMSGTAARKVVNHWRLNMDYLAAIRELDLSLRGNG